MATIVRQLLNVVKDNGGIVPTLRRAWNEGYVRALLDGNLFETKRRSLGATLVGTDSHGNKYYERMDVQYESWDYNASTVPPEWHGWLHHITDCQPPQLELLRPSYGRNHVPNLTGQGEGLIYHAKGHAMNPQQRGWAKFEGWRPTSVSEVSSK
eukprot:TRINITY_DN9603_c0_g1_i3.p1 TRINITY_DN9603_c0_g1~~TRINITY_DN9603_c0_g1_i3.p1  ORF type:complete len:154 (-),score=28.35 TRINITY_DN9603_c0_g1_i3:341-802(-)